MSLNLGSELTDLNEEMTIEIMKEKGYTYAARIENKPVLCFIKKTDIGFSILADVNYEKQDVILNVVELEYGCGLTITKFNIFNHKFNDFEQTIYNYARICREFDKSSADVSGTDGVSTPSTEPKKPKKQAPTIEERKSEFWNKIRQVGKEKQYDKDMCKEFYEYWTEMNTNGKKMRFELQQVFDVMRRLLTWLNNDKKWLNNYMTRGERLQEKKIQKLDDKVNIQKEVIDTKSLF